MKTITTSYLLTVRPGTVLIHRRFNNADGTPMRAKVNGQPKTWKSRPGHVRVPMKHGLRDYFYIASDAITGIDRKVGDVSPDDWAIPETVNTEAGGFHSEEYAKREELAPASTPNQ